MYKILKGFFLANGYEGKEGALVIDSTFTKSEIASLTKDGSIELEKVGAKSKVTAPKKVATKPKKKVK